MRESGTVSLVYIYKKINTVINNLYNWFIKVFQESAWDMSQIKSLLVWGDPLEFMWTDKNNNEENHRENTWLFFSATT